LIIVQRGYANNCEYKYFTDKNSNIKGNFESYIHTFAKYSQINIHFFTNTLFSKKLLSQYYIEKYIYNY